MNYAIKRDAKPCGKTLFQYVENPIVRLLFYLAVILVIASSSNKAGVFWSANNLKSMMIQMPEFGILSMCFALCICHAGGNDLSAVAVANFTAVISAMLLKYVFPAAAGSAASIVFILIALMAALVAGGAAGALNGVLTARIGICNW